MRFRAPDETDQLLPPENSRSVYPIYVFVTERRYRLSFYFRWLGRLTPSCAIARTLGNVRVIPETESASRRFSIASADRRGNVSFGPWARPLLLRVELPNERFLLVLLRDDLPLTAPSPCQLVRCFTLSSFCQIDLVSTGCRLGQDSFRSSPRERRRTFEPELPSIDKAPS